MKRLATALLVVLCVSVATQSNAQGPCRPASLPMPGSPIPVPPPLGQFPVDEIGHQVAPIPFPVFAGDVVLIQGDQALADLQSCLYYQQGVINPDVWSDVLHFDNNNPAFPSQMTLYSDCTPNSPEDPCNPPYEIPFAAVYGASSLTNPVFIPESATGPTVYFPIPGLPVSYLIDSDPVEPPAHPGCPTGPGSFVFTLAENCTGTKVVDGTAEIAIDCQSSDPVTHCPAFLLDPTLAFTPGWVRIHEGAASQPVSDLLHFFGGHFVSFCSDQPAPNETPEVADVGVPTIPAGDPDPIVDIVEDAIPTVYTCGTAIFQILSDPPEPTATHRTSWGRIKSIYR